MFLHPPSCDLTRPGQEGGVKSADTRTRMFVRPAQVPRAPDRKWAGPDRAWPAARPGAFNWKESQWRLAPSDWC